MPRFSGASICRTMSQFRIYKISSPFGQINDSLLFVAHFSMNLISYSFSSLYLNCTFWYRRQHIIAIEDFSDCIPSGHRQRVHWTEKCILNRQNHMTANEALSNIIISFVKCTILYLFWYQMNFSLSIDRYRVLSLLRAKCYFFRAQLHWMR